MIKIMFVCHGNICRSPMAEFILKDLLKKSGREEEFFVSSSATSREEIYNGIGNPVYPPAQRELLKHGISCEGKRAQQLKKEDYDNYDLFLCMDERNVGNTLRIFGGDRLGKVKKLMTYAGIERDISDPWYSGDFSGTYSDILKSLNGLLEVL